MDDDLTSEKEYRQVRGKIVNAAVMAEMWRGIYLLGALALAMGAVLSITGGALVLGIGVSAVGFAIGLIGLIRETRVRFDADLAMEKIECRHDRLKSVPAIEQKRSAEASHAADAALPSNQCEWRQRISQDPNPLSSPGQRR